MYTKIESIIWRDAKFQKLTVEARLAFIYLLTCPHRNILGLYVLPEDYAASDLGWTQAKFRAAVSSLEQACMVSRTNEFVLLVNYLKHNAPENPNSIKAGIDKLRELAPPGNLLSILLATAHAVVAERPYVQNLIDYLESLSHVSAAPAGSYGTHGDPVEGNHADAVKASANPTVPKVARFAQYDTVVMKDREWDALNLKFPGLVESMTEDLHLAIAGNGYKCKDAYLTVLKWEKNGYFSHQKKGGRKPSGAPSQQTRMDILKARFGDDAMKDVTP